MVPPRCQVLLQILLAILAVGLPCIAAICIVLGVRGNSVEVVLVEAAVLLVAIVPIANQAPMHILYAHACGSRRVHACACMCMCMCPSPTRRTHAHAYAVHAYTRAGACVVHV